MPYGTHKIKWFIEDGCGNETICEYTFVVKDCKKPTVVCINGLSVNMMPTKMITLWDTDFLQYTEDNCTPSGQLVTAIRKSGTGTGFPLNPDGTPQNSVTFTCDELGTQLVELWSIDKAGNADYCETYVIVQDNMGACDGNSGTVAGSLKTEQLNGLEEAKVDLNDSHPDFEDNESLEYVKKEIKTGKTLEDLKQTIPQLEKWSFDEKETVSVNDFWKISKKGYVVIDSYSYKRWLESNGFYKYYPDGADGFVFIRVENNLIDNTTEDKLKDFVLNELLKISEFKVYEFLASNSKYFKEDYLNLLDNIRVEFKEDTIDTGYIYFRNCAVKVTPKSKEIIDYIDLGGFVWKKLIMDYEFKNESNLDCDFQKFISLISSNDIERYRSVVSTIGYLMHSFKTSANNKAIILNDETISENPTEVVVRVFFGMH